MSKPTRHEHRSLNTANEEKAGYSDRQPDARILMALCVLVGLLCLAVSFRLNVIFPTLETVVAHILLAVIYLALSGAAWLIYVLRFSKYRRRQNSRDRYLRTAGDIFRTVADIPYAVMTRKGTVVHANDSLCRIAGSSRSRFRPFPISALSHELSADKILSLAAREAESDTLHVLPSLPDTDDSPLPTVLLKNNRHYEVSAFALADSESADSLEYLVIFRDRDEAVLLKQQMDREHPVLAYIMPDNLQELSSFVRGDYRFAADTVSQVLSQWVSDMGGTILEYDRDKYFAVFFEQSLDVCTGTGFPILEKIRGIRLGDNSFPISVSMGIADTNDGIYATNKAAQEALSIALGRGGGQIVVKRRGIDGYQYFGGVGKTIETNTSISSRLAVELVEKQLTDCENVLIMGHKFPDFDSVGSCVGMYRLCRASLDANGRPDVSVRIVVGKNTDTLEVCRHCLFGDSATDSTGMFADVESARLSVCEKTLLILCDANNMSILEEPELPAMVSPFNVPNSECCRIAVIDHHRMVGELPFIPFLRYIESTKSSASEIVAEMLLQSPYRQLLPKEEANLLLSGIMLDTHNFTRSAGSQTFSAVSYLYERHAHTDVVKEFFNQPIEDMRIDGEFNANVSLYRKVFALTYVKDASGDDAADRIAASKAADKLMELRGVYASFALVPIGQKVAVSGRSTGKINVQLILEKLGGGGHFDMAGAQTKGPVDHALEQVKDAISEYLFEYSDLCKELGINMNDI